MPDTEFRKGDAVVLARGPNWGTRGIFLDYRKDAKWADITEAGAGVRAHPVEWLERGSAPEAIESKEYTG
jgi:ribosomal protein L24